MQSTAWAFINATANTINILLIPNSAIFLNCNFYPIAFGVEDDAFVIPVAGGSWLPHYLDSVSRHLPGESVHLFF